MAKYDDFKWQEESGQESVLIDDVAYDEVTKLAMKFIKEVQRLGRERGVVDSGNLLSDDSFSIKEVKDGNLTGIELFMLDYADYVNKGVKGWGSSSKAPASPYQFKTKGMPAKARKSIMQSIQRGTLKMTNVNPKYKIGLERKYKQGSRKKSILEKQADRIAYLVKRFGIERTGYIDDSMFNAFKDLDVKAADVFMSQFYITLINR